MMTIPPTARTLHEMQDIATREAVFAVLIWENRNSLSPITRERAVEMAVETWQSVDLRPLYWEIDAAMRVLVPWLRNNDQRHITADHFTDARRAFLTTRLSQTYKSLPESVIADMVENTLQTVDLHRVDDVIQVALDQYMDCSMHGRDYGHMEHVMNAVMCGSR